MDALDLEAPAVRKETLLSRASALWRSVSFQRQQRFERLEQAEAFEEEKPLQEAGKREGFRWCPEEDAGVLSGIIYHYCSGLIRIGYRKPLLQDDLWDVCHRDRSNTVCSSFQTIFERTKQNRTTPKGCLLGTIVRAHAWTFAFIGCIKMLDIILLFASPLLLERLLVSLQEGRPAGATLGVAVVMFVIGSCESLVNNRQMHLSMRMTMHLKSELIGMLYGKSLRLHSAARAEFGTGAIVNLQSNDAQKLWWLPVFMHVLWAAPLQILVVCLLLVRVMGVWPAAAGLLTTLLLVPTSSFVGRRLSKARKAVVVQTDARVKLTTEVILGIRAIKLYSWEGPFVERIMELRNKELASIKLAAIYNALNTVLFLGGPMFISLAAFTVYGALGYQLTAAVAFPSLSLFNLLRFPLMMLPEQILNVVQGKVALSRLQNFLQADEMQQDEVRPPAAPGETAMTIRQGNFAWEMGGPSILHDINLEVAHGQLVIVVGKVGSGKTSLLSAFLGEMVARGGGEVVVTGRVGYTAQDPWICNASMRENILMGSPLDQAKYDRTLDACALQPDIAELAGGDAAEIGEKGVNLSGGQRARVSLARACYSGADTYLLDDPLSAVDAHVGQHLFQHCICGMLKSSTRVLVTHQLQFLPSADVIVILSEGQVVHTGTYRSLTAAGVEFRQFAVEEVSDSDSEVDAFQGHNLPAVVEEVAHHLKEEAQQDRSLEDRECSAAAPVEAAVPQIQAPYPSDDPASSSQASSSGDENRPPQESIPHHRRDDKPPVALKQSANSMDLGSQLLRTTLENANPPGEKQPASNFGMVSRFAESAAELHPIVEGGAPSEGRRSREMSRTGSSKMTRSASNRSSRAGTQGLSKQSGIGSRKGQRFGKIVETEERATGRVEMRMYKSYLRAWSKTAFALPLALVMFAACERALQVIQNFWLSVWTDSTAASTQRIAMDNRPYIAIYFALGAFSIVVQGFRLLIMVTGAINATKLLHANLLDKVVRLPLSFFSSQPTGRLLNRFARDTEAVDTKVPNALGSFLNCLVNVVGSLVINLLVTPLVIVPLLPMAYVYDIIRRRFVTTSREIKRLDSLAMSPIFGMFSETLQGLVSVRAFRLQSDFGSRHNSLLDASTRCWWPLVCCNRWLSVRLEFIGTLLVFFTAVAAAVVLPRSAGLAGLAITAALNLTGLMNWTVRQSTELEVQMNSVERMLAYTTEYAAEKPAVISHRRPPSDWPSRGEIVLQDLVVTYRADLPPVLKGLSLRINSQEKVGVAGRTGGGKSTLMMALFRIVEPQSGKIYIDNLDIAEMGLFDLRSRLALVPQDPVVFSGTVRANLDPFGSIQGDSLIWKALERAGLHHTITNLPGGLEADITEGGANLSSGQRQLLCMARALLRQSKILVLDEATSSIDNETDGLIQATVRSAFKDCTVLTVAHRLHTISDCDRILVLDSGNVKEFDSPSKLLKDPSSAFYGLVMETTQQHSFVAEGS